MRALRQWFERLIKFIKYFLRADLLVGFFVLAHSSGVKGVGDK